MLANRLAALFLLALATLGHPGCAAEEPPRDLGFSEGVDGKEDASRGAATRYPIVLVHGMNASATTGGFSERFVQDMRAAGNQVFVADLPPFESPQVRGRLLADQIDQALAEFGADKVNIIAHSLGTLDSRFAISTLGYGDRVAAYVSISGPHHGVHVAEVLLGQLGGVPDDLLNQLAGCFGKLYSNVADDTAFRATLEAITPAALEEFNAANPDDPRVLYVSFAGVALAQTNRDAYDNREVNCEGKMLYSRYYPNLASLPLEVSAGTVAGPEHIANDGAVNVESAKRGYFGGCIPADHIDETGASPLGGRDLLTGFDVINFYRDLTRALAASGR